jgi:uncharacterized OB-fold protein
MSESPSFALPEGLPVPVPESDGLSRPFWEGLKNEQLLLQRCAQCRTWQWGPEWICHKCHSFDMKWEAVEPQGTVYVAERVWHPTHPALKTGVPYLIVLVQIPAAGNVRLLGNILADPMTTVAIGASVRGVFEHHGSAANRYSLLQWKLA